MNMWVPGATAQERHGPGLSAKLTELSKGPKIVIGLISSWCKSEIM